AAREFAHDLGRAHTYQLRRSDAAEETAANRRSPTDRTSSARRLSARTPFDPPLSYQELEERTAQGMVVRSTRLSAEYPLAAYREDNPGAVLLFAHDRSGTRVVTESQPPSDSGVTLISLTQPRATGPGSTGPRATQEAQRAD